MALSKAEKQAIALGNFDGVHKGHQEVLRDVVRRAKSLGMRSFVLTFDPPPSLVLTGKSKALLTTLEEKQKRILALGIDGIHVQPFTASFASQTAEEFVNNLLVKELHAGSVTIGPNFFFGKNREGNVDTLRQLGEKYHFGVNVFPCVGDEKGMYSSSRIREALKQGRLSEVRDVLGRDHMLSGFVVHGEKRGRTLGFPTANLGDVREMIPRLGVYACEVEGAFGLRKGVVNIGKRPSVSSPQEGESELSVEVHLFDFEGDLYGSALCVSLCNYLRAEKKFASLEALRLQIVEDEKNARAFFAKEGTF